mmetsp:Transcript_32271/g.102633  ORF Transcript_32271/g.102633 Transcript_32271/m.102633 type:complete len:332 (+) Transcript_32271:2277-3272(+)
MTGRWPWLCPRRSRGCALAEVRRRCGSSWTTHVCRDRRRTASWRGSGRSAPRHRSSLPSVIPRPRRSPSPSPRRTSGRRGASVGRVEGSTIRPLPTIPAATKAEAIATTAMTKETPTSSDSSAPRCRLTSRWHRRSRSSAACTARVPPGTLRTLPLRLRTKGRRRCTKAWMRRSRTSRREQRGCSRTWTRRNKVPPTLAPKQPRERKSLERVLLMRWPGQSGRAQPSQRKPRRRRSDGPQPGLGRRPRVTPLLRPRRSLLRSPFGSRLPCLMMAKAKTLSRRSGGLRIAARARRRSAPGGTCASAWKKRGEGRRGTRMQATRSLRRRPSRP